MTSVPSVKLNDGTTVPAVGFGTGTSLLPVDLHHAQPVLPSIVEAPLSSWQYIARRSDAQKLMMTGTALYNKECADMVLSALKHGYRYLDSAQMYGNGASMGEAIKQWGGKREDVYILTKSGYCLRCIVTSRCRPRRCGVDEEGGEGCRSARGWTAIMFMPAMPLWANGISDRRAEWRADGAVGMDSVPETDPREALEEQLKLLGVDYVDLCESGLSLFCPFHLPV
jgi:aryl-alcohol dehydrogenase-like predicted oxidoreductase